MYVFNILTKNRDKFERKKGDMMKSLEGDEKDRNDVIIILKNFLIKKK